MIAGGFERCREEKERLKDTKRHCKVDGVFWLRREQWQLTCILCVFTAEEKAGICGEGGADAAGSSTASGCLWEERTAWASATHSTGERAWITANATGKRCTRYSNINFWLLIEIWPHYGPELFVISTAIYRYISKNLNIMKKISISCHSFQKVKPIYYIDSLQM